MSVPGTGAGSPQAAATGPARASKPAIAAVHELAPMQLGMLYHALEAGADHMYTVLLGYRLEGPLDPAAFTEAWRRAAVHHEILRTAFVWERVQRPRQVVLATAELPVSYHDWSDRPAAERERLLAVRYEQERAATFDLAKPPLMRLCLVRLAEDVHEFVWSLHHVVLDGWSMTRLLTEVFEDYAALRDGRPLPDRDPPAYGTYVAWLARQDATAGEAYWRRLLDGVAPAPPLGASQTGTGPASRPADGGSGQRETTVPADVVARVHEASASLGVTLGTVVHATWALQLARLTLRPEVTFGSVVWGRPHDLPRADQIIGPCMNTLPVRTPVPADTPLHAWVSGLHAQLLRGREHDHVPLARIRSLTALPPGQPLFESVVAFQRFAGGDGLAGAIDGLRVTETVSTQHVSFPLALEVGGSGGAHLRLLHDPARFSQDQVDRILDELSATFRRLPDHLEDPVATLVGGDAARAGGPPAHGVGLHEGQASRPVSLGEPVVVEEVAAQVRRRPDEPAVCEADRSWRYRDLDRHADEVAAWLRSRGLGRGDLVGVAVPRGGDLVAAQLGAMRAGAAFLPLDPDDVPDRLAGMLARAGARAVVTTAALEQQLPPVVPHLLRTVDARRGVVATDSAAALGPATRLDGRDLAYGIHTSGSTGEPKCVGIEHAGLSNLAAWTRARFGLGAADRCGLLCNPAFDGSVWEIWPCLTAGGSLHPVPDDVRLDPAALRDWLVAAGITVTFVPTALLEPLLCLPWPSAEALRFVLTGGEALSQRPPPGLPFELVNNYGVAEASVVQTSAPVLPAPPGTGPPGIGTPITGTRVVLLDARGEPVPAGTVGELCVGGVGVARGYLGRPAATAERFVPDPGSPVPGARLYRTGDLARQLPDGSLEYAGRADDQVQVRGYRVELGEVEAALLTHPQVARAVVRGRRDGDGAPVALEAHVVAGDDRPPAGELHRYLAQRLPAHMVPARLAFLDALPVTANGKVDRAALAPAPVVRAGERPEVVEPRNDLERTLATIAGDVLGVERVGVHDDLFDLGCNSILSIQIVARTKQAGLALGVRDLFSTSTVAGLAGLLEPGAAGEGVPRPADAAASADRSACLRPLRAVPGVPLFAVHPISGRAGCYAALAAHLGDDRPVYGLQEPDSETGAAPRTIEAMAARYVEAVRGVHREGPYLLAGWSFGGLVAAAMAQILVDEGQDVALLALIDTPAPSVARHLPDYDPRRAAKLVRRELRDASPGAGPDLADGALMDGAQDWARAVEGDYRRRIEAARRYRPLGCAVPPVVLRASEPARGRRYLPRQVRRRLADPTFGWGELWPRPAAVLTLPGSHDTLLAEPGIRALATALDDQITRATARGADDDPVDDPVRRTRDDHAGGTRWTRPQLPQPDVSGTRHGRRGAGDMAAITFQAVSKRYGDTLALDDLSLEVPQGEVVAVLGPNGAGKTTAVSLMVGLRAPTSGTVRVLGADPRDRDVRSHCGVMLQDARLPESLRCRELVDLFRSYYPDPLDTAEALDLSGLTEEADEFAGRLSGGQRQRLQYALAICGRPRLLFLDEPTVGMDVTSRRAFLAEVGRFAESGATIVLTTHYLDEAEQLADRVVVVDRGRVIADAPPNVLKADVPSRQVTFDWAGGDLPPLDGVPAGAVTVTGGRALVLSNEPDRTVAALVAAGLSLPNLEVRGADLEDAFVALTSRSGEQETVR